MKKIKTPLWITILIILLLPISLPILVVTNIIIGIHFSIWTQKKPKYYQYQFNSFSSYQQLFKYQKETAKKYHHLFFSKLEFDKMFLKQEYINNKNIKLNCLFLKSTLPSEKWIIVCHGWTENSYQALNIAWYWLKYGYNVCLYDARGHGSSSQTTTTVGIREKGDLFKVINYLVNNFKPSNIGLIGHSMGAATVIEYLKKYQSLNINFAIVDGCFTTLVEQYKWMVIKKYHAFPCFGIYGMVVFNKLLYNFNPIKCQPVKNLDLINETPVLVIHSLKDEFIIYEMGQKLFQNKIKFENKQISNLLTLEQSLHTKSMHEHFEQFISTTIAFANKHTVLKGEKKNGQ